MRGINRQTIFEDEQDYKKFIGTLEKYKEICKYELYAYCLMGNHIHILLKEGLEPLEQVMRRICGSYVFWYIKSMIGSATCFRTDMPVNQWKIMLIS
jgi:REP element-mobilizing transposase RayT